MRKEFKTIVQITIGIIAISLIVTVFTKIALPSSSSHFETVFPNSEEKGYNGVINDVINNGFKMKDFAEGSYTSLNTKYSANEINGLTQYEVNNQKINYDSSSITLIEDNVYYNDDNFAKEVYYNRSMFIDTQFLGDNQIEYLYDSNYQLTDIGINGGSINYEYDSKGNIISQSFNGKLEHTYSYDENNYLINDKNHINNKNNEYMYDEKGNLIISKMSEYNIDYFNEDIVLTVDGQETRYKFGYEFNGNRYVNEITHSNGNKTKLTYLNDRVTSADYNGEVVTYILNSDLKPLGFSFNNNEYYYVKSATNNIYSINLNNGQPVCFYNLDPYGNYDTIEKRNISKINGYLLDNYYLDTFNNVYLGTNGIMIPSLNIKYNLNKELNKLNFKDNNINYDKDNFIRSSVSGLKAIEGMVASNVIENLESKNIEAVANVETIDSNNKIDSSVDIFVLPFGIYSEQPENLFNGNQIFEIVYNDSNDTSYKDFAIKKLEGIKKVLYMEDSYEDANDVKKGTLKFNGQFIYLGYYVEYHSNGDGIINFSVKDNNTTNYQMFMNLYDYDNAKYLNLNENTFDFEEDFKDAVSIIPGFNQEIYDVCTDYVESFEQFEGQIVQETVEFLDSSYVDNANISYLGDSLDFFEDIDLDNDMVVLSKQGGVTVKSLPFYLAKDGQKKLIMTAAGIVAVTLVSVLSVATGTGVVVVPMLSMAVKGAVTSIFADSIVSTTISAVKYFANSINGNSGSLSLIDVLNESMTDVVSRCTTTAITGALFYGYQGLKHGKTIKQNKAILEEIDNMPSYLHYDCPEVYSEYMSLKYSIENSGMQSVEHYLISNHSPSIVKCLLKKGRNRSVKEFVKEVVE